MPPVHLVRGFRLCTTLHLQLLARSLHIVVDARDLLPDVPEVVDEPGADVVQAAVQVRGDLVDVAAAAEVAVIDGRASLQL